MLLTGIESPRGDDCGGRDADAGRCGGDAAAGRAGLGSEADRGRVGVQPQHGEAVPAAGWLGVVPRSGRASALAGLEGWLAERFRQHRGNADVVRQELAREHGVRVSLRTVERAVAGLRRDLLAEARATRALRDAARPAAADRLRRDAWCRSAARRCGSTCSWRRWATRAAASWRRFGTSGNRLGSRAWRRPSATLAGCRARSCSTTPEPLVVRHDAVTREVRVQRAAARLCALLGIPAAGLRAVPGADQGQGRARRRLRQEQRDRRPQRSPAGRRWRRTLSGGCARLPISASMAPPASRRSSGSGGRRPRRWRRSMGRPPFRQVRELVRRVQADGCGRSRHQRLQRALAADRRAGPGRGRRLAWCASSTPGWRSPVTTSAAAGVSASSTPPTWSASSPTTGGSPVTPAAASAEVGELLRPLAEYEQIAGGGW